MTEPRSWSRRSAAFTGETHLLVSPGPRADSPLVVLCHGMGETPDREILRWPAVAALPAHVVAPAGPYPHEVRSPRGVRIGHAWYLYDGGAEPFKRSLDRAVSWLHDLLATLETAHGWQPRERTLVGFSQGAYFGYVAALGEPRPFRRLVAVAGRLKEEFVTLDPARAFEVETLILHGKNDTAVSPDAGRRSADALHAAGYRATLRVFAGAHRVTPECDAAAADWLARAWGPCGA